MRLWEPRARLAVVRVATPALRVAVPRLLLPSRKVTVPVGLSVPDRSEATVAVKVTPSPKLGAASWVTDLYDSAVDAIGKSLDLTWQPGYAAAVDAKVADIRARWRRYIGERMCEAVFPGGSVFYFADRRTALRFEGEYQRLVDAQCRVMRLAPRCVRPEAFKERMRRLEKTRLVSDCTNLYTPGLEPEFRKDMEEDAMEYVRRLMAADAKK